MNSESSEPLSRRLSDCIGYYNRSRSEPPTFRIMNSEFRIEFHLPISTTIIVMSSSLPFSALLAARAMRSASSPGEPLSSLESSRESHKSSSTAPSVVMTIISPAETWNFCAGTVTLPPEPTGGDDREALSNLSEHFM